MQKALRRQRRDFHALRSSNHRRLWSNPELEDLALATIASISYFSHLKHA
jgi:hypothetical protein